MDPLRRAAAAAPDAVALATHDGRWSYRSLDAAADRFAGRLARLLAAHVDLRSPPRVGLLLPPGAEAVLAIHAVPRAGAVLAPLNPRWSDRELDRAFRTLLPAALVAVEETVDRARALSPTIPTLPISRSDLDAGADAGADAARDADSDPDVSLPDRAGASSTHDLFAILWTSGTSGSPRGVELTLENFEASARGARERLDLRADDVWHASLSPAHVGGLALLVRAAMVGCRVEAREGFSAAGFSRLIDENVVTHASLVPAMLDQLLEARGERPAPSSLRCILLGGAAPPRSLLERAVELGFPIALTYGLTEAASQVATAPPELVRDELGMAEGLPAVPPLPGVEVRIAPDGEILVRGSTVAKGYFAPAAAFPVTPAPPAPAPPAPGTPTASGSASAEHPSPPIFPRDPAGWLRTGDLGRLDERGRLRVVGRISDRIISGGVNVDPAEVEAVVRMHPAVADAAVVGLPDLRWGERVGVAVVLQAEGDAESPLAARMLEPEALTVEALLEFTRPHLSAAKRPRALLIVEALPRNAGGKVDRGRLQALDWR